jgi:hypothetical protein
MIDLPSKRMSVLLIIDVHRITRMRTEDRLYIPLATGVTPVVCRSYHDARHARQREPQNQFLYGFNILIRWFIQNCQSLRSSPTA